MRLASQAHAPVTRLMRKAFELAAAAWATEINRLFLFAGFAKEEVDDDNSSERANNKDTNEELDDDIHGALKLPFKTAGGKR